MSDEKPLDWIEVPPRFGRHPIYGRLAGIGILKGERYYWFVDRHGDVSMMPAGSVEQSIVPCEPPTLLTGITIPEGF